MSNFDASLVFLIPALNEVKTIGDVVSQLREFGNVIVVDDGSFDRTSEVAKLAGACVIRHDINIGYDQAILTGFTFAQKGAYSWAITVDADGQHKVNNIPVLLKKIKDSHQLDIVLGCRDGFARTGEWVLSILYRFRWGISDPLCGLKAYRLDFYRKHTWALESEFDSIGTTIMLNYISRHAKYDQFDVKTSKRSDESRFGNALKVNMRILKCLYFTATTY